MEGTSQFNISLSDLEIVKSLGKGGFGSVQLVKYKDAYFALKKVPMGVQMNHQLREKVLKEAQFLRGLKHPHIIKLYDCFFHQEVGEEGVNKWVFCLLMEYAHKGDLTELIDRHRFERQLIPEETIWKICQQIAEGLAYLHEKKIIHRDIKCQNILVFSAMNCTYKIADMGISKSVSNKVQLHVGKSGTPLYLSPEVIKRQPFDFRMDMWAFGCVLHYLAALEHPFSIKRAKYSEIPQRQRENFSQRELIQQQILNSTQSQIPDSYSSRLQILIQRLLDKNQFQRPTAKEVLLMIPQQEPKHTPLIQKSTHALLNRPVKQGECQMTGALQEKKKFVALTPLINKSHIKPTFIMQVQSFEGIEERKDDKQYSASVILEPLKKRDSETGSIGKIGDKGSRMQSNSGENDSKEFILNQKTHIYMEQPSKNYTPQIPAFSCSQQQIIRPREDLQTTNSTEMNTNHVLPEADHHSFNQRYWDQSFDSNKGHNHVLERQVRNPFQTQASFTSYHHNTQVNIQNYLRDQHYQLSNWASINNKSNPHQKQHSLSPGRDSSSGSFQVLKMPNIHQQILTQKKAAAVSYKGQSILSYLQNSHRTSQDFTKVQQSNSPTQIPKRPHFKIGSLYGSPLVSKFSIGENSCNDLQEEKLPATSTQREFSLNLKHMGGTSILVKNQVQLQNAQNLNLTQKASRNGQPLIKASKQSQHQFSIKDLLA